MTNHPNRQRAVLTINGRKVDFGTCNSYVCVYGATGNLKHNSDYVIGGNTDQSSGVFLYSVRYQGETVYEAGKLSDCAAWCATRGARPGEFYDTSIPDGAFRGWNAGKN